MYLTHLMVGKLTHTKTGNYKPIKAEFLDLNVYPLTPTIEKSLEAIANKFYDEFPNK
jgi:hypothetical protein